MDKLIELGKHMGLDGHELKEFVIEQYKIEREEHSSHSAKELEKERIRNQALKEKADREIEQLKIQAEREIEQLKIQAEKEKAERDAELDRLKLQVHKERADREEAAEQRRFQIQQEQLRLEHELKIETATKEHSMYTSITQHEIHA